MAKGRQFNVYLSAEVYDQAILRVADGRIAAWLRGLAEREVGVDGQEDTSGLSEGLRVLTERMDKASKAHCDLLTRMKVLEQRTPVKELVSADDNPFAKPEDTFRDSTVVYDEGGSQ